MKAKFENLNIDELSKLIKLLGCLLDELTATKDPSDRNIAWRVYEIIDEVENIHGVKCRLKNAVMSREYCQKIDKLLEDLRK